ncbi:MAG: DUF2752 domain-containing protein [Planctomycetota bacterium]|nr:DUF2752 domain-containing protein [Planctomycetota bacterium]
MQLMSEAALVYKPEAITAQNGAVLSARERTAAAGVAAAVSIPLVLASFVQPASEGFGTHMQLGIPRCAWPMTIGLPCPSCGYTTAFSHAAHGHWWTSFVTQPAGFILCLLAAMTVVIALMSAVLGQPIWRLFAPLATSSVAWIGGLLFLLGWGFKIGSFKGWW